MPLVVNMISGSSFLIEGEAAPPKPWKAGRFIVAQNLNTGCMITLHLSAVAACEVWPKAQYDAQVKAKAEAERKRNPSPGREPRIVIPRKPS
jgi:hypothetical protein